MLAIDDASARLIASLTATTDIETVRLDAANQRVLGTDVIAPISLPPFDSSAMDGYAVRSQDCVFGTESLRVVGTSFAGKPFTGILGDGEAVRIFTGAAVPSSTDAVVIQEDTDRDGDVIALRTTVRAGENIRPAGHDVNKGELLLALGAKLGAFEIGWLAACGIADVAVTRRIRVAIFSTGDELQAPGTPLAAGQIYDSNRATLKELLRAKAVTIRDLGCLPDDPATIEETIRSLVDEVDVIVTSGGVSVGDADYVRPVIDKLGELTFWNVALKPGKPIAFAKLGNAWFLGLPGNPVSTVVCYLLFVAPAIDALSGMSVAAPLTLSATLMEPLRHAPGRREYQRGVLFRENGDIRVASAGDQSSNRLSSLAAANCLIIVPETAGSLVKGQLVDVLPLPREAHHFLRGSDNELRRDAS